MISRIATPAVRRAAIVFLLLLALAIGYVASAGGSSPAHAQADLDPSPGPSARASVVPVPGGAIPLSGATTPSGATPPSGATTAPNGATTPDGATTACGATVLEALSQVAQHVYNEGVASERTEIAERSIADSSALREAVESGNSVAVHSAAQALLASGHVTNLTVLRSNQVLATVGSPGALAPLNGTILSKRGAPIASFVTSVWADSGFISEMKGVIEGDVALRQDGHGVGGSFALPAGELPPAGTLTVHGELFQYASFPATAYPSGSLRIYILRTVHSTAAFCGQTPQDSLVKALGRVASLIYAGEGGAHAHTQVRRAQRDAALLQAVAERNPAATRKAVVQLVYDHTHIVRLRVSAGGQLLSDVGGPYVLAPVSAPLRLHGKLIGSMTLSIQDDEGYLRLAKRLVGLDVLMYMNPTTHPELVKNSLGPGVGGFSSVPVSGSYTYRGQNFRVFTLNARSFPSGPLRISVLIPIPYS